MKEFTPQEKQRLINYAKLESDGVIALANNFLKLDTTTLQGKIACLEYRESKVNIVKVFLGVTSGTLFEQEMRHQGLQLGAIVRGTPMLDELVGPLQSYYDTISRTNFYESVLRAYNERGRSSGGVVLVDIYDVIRMAFSQRADAEQFYQSEEGAIRAHIRICYVKTASLIGDEVIDFTRAESPQMTKLLELARAVRSNLHDCAFGES